MMNSGKALAFALLVLVGSNQAAKAQADAFPNLVGEWRDVNTAQTVIIKGDGRVFSNGSPIRGSVQKSGEAGGNFAFENEQGRCVYEVVFIANGGASWGLRSETKQGYCPKVALFYRTSEDKDGKADAERLLQQSKNVDVAASKDSNSSKDTSARSDAMASSPSREPTRPHQFEGFDIVYLEKHNDEGLVRQALEKNQVKFRTAEATNLGKSNTITCTPDISSDDIRKFVSLLIEAEIPIRAIKPSFYADRKKRFSIETYSGDSRDAAIITPDEIRNIEACSFHLKGASEPPFRFYVNNSCAGSLLDLYLLYYDPKSKKWVYATEFAVEYGQEVVFTDDDGREVVSSSPNAYYYAVDSKSKRRWGGGSEGLFRRLPILDESVYMKKLTSRSPNLTCE